MLQWLLLLADRHISTCQNHTKQSTAGDKSFIIDFNPKYYLYYTPELFVRSIFSESNPHQTSSHVNNVLEK